MAAIVSRKRKAGGTSWAARIRMTLADGVRRQIKDLKEGGYVLAVLCSVSRGRF